MGLRIPSLGLGLGGKWRPEMKRVGRAREKGARGPGLGHLARLCGWACPLQVRGLGVQRLRLLPSFSPGIRRLCRRLGWAAAAGCSNVAGEGGFSGRVPSPWGLQGETSKREVVPRAQTQVPSQAREVHPSPGPVGLKLTPLPPQPSLCQGFLGDISTWQCVPSLGQRGPQDHEGKRSLLPAESVAVPRSPHL